MRIATYNILDAGVGRIDPLAEVLRLARIDVAILQECSDSALFHKLADRLNMDRFLAENPRNPAAAVGLLSHWTIRQAINHAPLDSRLTRSALSATLTDNEAEISLIGLHLHARETIADEQIRLAELPAILEIAQQFQGKPHLLAGDFNSSHPDQIIDIARLRSKSRERIAAQNNQLPREVLRTLIAAGYVDTHALHRSPEQFGHSLSTSHPAMRVDFILASPELAPAVTACEIFTPEMARFASDHFPVVAQFNLPSALPSTSTLH